VLLSKSLSGPGISNLLSNGNVSGKNFPDSMREKSEVPSRGDFLSIAVFN
jgi:hypothetical protein